MSDAATGVTTDELAAVIRLLEEALARADGIAAHLLAARISHALESALADAADSPTVGGP